MEEIEKVEEVEVQMPIEVVEEVTPPQETPAEETTETPTE